MIIEKISQSFKNTLQKTSLKKRDENSIKAGWAISLP
jgi:hypothetical protein